MPPLGLLDKHGNGGEGLSNRTLNRYTSCLAAVFRWAEERGYRSGTNPFAGQARKIASYRKTGWMPFTDQEVLTILRALPENQHDAMHWVPLIGAYSGMRSNETCSLTTNDIREEGGIHYFDVTRAKADAGQRRVPIHSEVIRAGFLEYLATLPPGAVFPSLKPGGRDGKLNWYFTKRFNVLRRRLGIDRLHKRLEDAEPDLLREMMRMVVAALMSAEVDAVCGAGYGEPSPERTNRRNG